MNIIFLSPYNPRDLKRWSGTINSIFVALQKRDIDIRVISGGFLDLIGRGSASMWMSDFLNLSA